MINLGFHILEIGLIFVPMVIGVFITSRLIKLDDLTLEGSFNLGGAFGAFLLVHELGALTTCLLTLAIGALLGALSGVLHTRLKVNHLISGLAVSAIAYSISLKLVNAHCVLNPSSTLFEYGSAFLSEEWRKLGILMVIASTLLLSLKVFLETEIGLLLKAVGFNKDWFYKLGKDPAHFQIVGLSIANSLCSLSGCLFLQWLGFYSISNYIGTWIAGLNGLMIAELIPSSLSLGLLLGSVLNQTLFAAVIELQMDPVWNQAIKAVLVITLLQLAKKPLNTRKKTHVAA